MNYNIILSETAISKLSDAITYEFKAPATAFRYMRELRNTIKSLKRTPESYPVQTRASLLQYGINVRRINYKRMAIIYTIHNDVIYIHRIIAGSMITGL